MSLVRLFALVLAMLAPVAAAAQQDQALLSSEQVRVCPGDGEARPPDFAAPGCSAMPFATVDPQGREIWVEARLVLDPADFPADRPLGLFVTGKASSTAFLNGRHVGGNGRPAATAADEVPGVFDAVLFVPRGLVRPGENVIVLRLSAMRGHLRLSNPMHFVALGPYADPQQEILAIYWPALVTLGIFLIGAIYFAITAWRGEDRAGSGIVALASLIAALQLLAEVARGLVPYVYPLHDLRLLAILLCACGFALTLIAYLARQLLRWRARRCAAACLALAVAMAVICVLEPGFDGKTLLALLAAVGAGFVLAAFAAREGRRGALSVAVVLAALAAAILGLGSRFLDFAFYLFAGALLAWLFYRQALAIVAERRLRRSEERRADRLEVALAKAGREPQRIELTTAGRADFVDLARIVRFAGAGDYVEAHFVDGASELYDDTLVRLEEALPADFVRVHRSHIVNAAFVRSLDKDGAGTGTLTLTDGAAVPVSRRVMPSVRRSLSGAAA